MKTLKTLTLCCFTLLTFSHSAFSQEQATTSNDSFAIIECSGTEHVGNELTVIFASSHLTIPDGMACHDALDLVKSNGFHLYSVSPLSSRVSYLFQKGN